MTTILDKILVETRQTIEQAKRRVPLETLQRNAETLPPPRDFHAALAAGEAVQLIAEVKKASPSAGIIRADFDPVAIARSYASAGAACLSVLTDEPFFQGHLDFLRAVRQAVDLPLLRKDFIVDPYQLWEARAAGADCVLLIAECLSVEELRTLHDQAHALGMQTLIELYEPENLPAVLATGTRLVGINNRNLRTFVTDLNHTIELAASIPDDRLVVGESGIREPADLRRLQAAGVKAVLVGESLMRQPDIAAAVRGLLDR
jgi:indole-3-glycerol phosphate synthase